MNTGLLSIILAGCCQLVKIFITLEPFHFHRIFSTNGGGGGGGGDGGSREPPEPHFDPPLKGGWLIYIY